MDINELKQLVDKWQKVEDNGGSPTSGEIENKRQLEKKQ